MRCPATFDDQGRGVDKNRCGPLHHVVSRAITQEIIIHAERATSENPGWKEPPHPAVKKRGREGLRRSRWGYPKQEPSA